MAGQIGLRDGITSGSNDASREWVGCKLTGGVTCDARLRSMCCTAAAKHVKSEFMWATGGLKGSDFRVARRQMDQWDRPVQKIGV